MNIEKIYTVVEESITSIKPALEGYRFSSGDTLAGLGLDSVERSQVVMNALEMLNLQIPLVQTFGPKNVGELAQLFQEKLSGN